MYFSIVAVKRRAASEDAVKMAGGNKNKLSREEELLLQDFSRNVSTKSSALFYGNALIVSAIPICKFCRKTVVSFESCLFTCCAGLFCDVDKMKACAFFAQGRRPDLPSLRVTLLPSVVLNLLVEMMLSAVSQ